MVKVKIESKERVHFVFAAGVHYEVKDLKQDGKKFVGEVELGDLKKEDFKEIVGRGDLKVLR